MLLTRAREGEEDRQGGGYSKGARDCFNTVVTETIINRLSTSQ